MGEIYFCSFAAKKTYGDNFLLNHDNKIAVFHQI